MLLYSSTGDPSGLGHQRRQLEVAPYSPDEMVAF